MTASRVRTVAMAVLLASMVAGCSKSEAAPLDPCRILPVASLSEAVGNPLDSGRPSGTGQSCQFRPVDGEGRTLLLSLLQQDTAQAFAEARRNAEDATGAPVEVIPGVGDEAFTWTAASGTQSSAEARQEALRVRVLVSGAGADQVPAMDLVHRVLKEAAKA